MTELQITAGTGERKSKVSVRPDFNGRLNGNSRISVESGHAESAVIIQAWQRDSYRAPFPVDEKSVERVGEVKLPQSTLVRAVEALSSDARTHFTDEELSRILSALAKDFRKRTSK